MLPRPQGNHSWWNHNCLTRRQITDDWSDKSCGKNMIIVSKYLEQEKISWHSTEPFKMYSSFSYKGKPALMLDVSTLASTCSFCSLYFSICVPFDLLSCISLQLSFIPQSPTACSVALFHCLLFNPHTKLLSLSLSHTHTHPGRAFQRKYLSIQYIDLLWKECLGFHGCEYSQLHWSTSYWSVLSMFYSKNWSILLCIHSH